jgi:hypothetical protein
VSALVVIVVAIAVIVPLVATATPEFFSRYHLLERRYVNLGSSAHEGIGCRACHETDALENGLALFGDFYVSMVTTDETPRYFEFGPPSNDACLACHEQDWSTEIGRTDKIPHPAHRRVSEETRVCVDCHKWTAHLETYLEKHQQMPFSGVCVAYGCHVGTKTSDECFDCHHVLHQASEEWRTEHPATVAKAGESICLEACHSVQQCQMCHTTGERPEFDGLPIEVSMKAIEELHVLPEWTAEYHGDQAIENRDNCLLCHQTTGECDECHRERPAFHGSTETWIGRHSDQTADLEDPRCIECHEQTWCEECHDQFKEME